MCISGKSDIDAVAITVSVQYLTQPVAVFQDVHRVLQPGGLFAVLFSNRMFPTKAVAIWRSLNDRQHTDLIATYFQLRREFRRLGNAESYAGGAGVY